MEELKKFASEHKIITIVIVLIIIGSIGNIFGSEETSTSPTYSGPNSAPISSSANPYNTADCVRVDAATINKINNNANAQYGAKLDTRGAYGVKIRSEYSSNWFLAAQYITPEAKSGSVDAFLVNSLTDPYLILPASLAADIGFGSAGGGNNFKTAPSLLGKSVESYEEFFEAVGCVMYPPAYSGSSSSVANNKNSSEIIEENKEVLQKEKIDLENEIIEKEEKIEEIKNGPKQKLAIMQNAFNESNYAKASQVYAEIKEKHPDSAEYQEALKIYEEIRAIEKKSRADAEQAIAAAAAEKKASLDKIVRQNDIPIQVDSFSGQKLYLPSIGRFGACMSSSPWEFCQSFLKTYVGVSKSGKPYFYLNARYVGDDRIFFDNVFLSYEGNTIEVPFNNMIGAKTTKAYGVGKVYEDINLAIYDTLLIDYLKKLSRSPDAKIRFSGDLIVDRNITALERKGMVQALWVWDAVN